MMGRYWWKMCMGFGPGSFCCCQRTWWTAWWWEEGGIVELRDLIFPFDCVEFTVPRRGLWQWQSFRQRSSLWCQLFRSPPEAPLSHEGRQCTNLGWLECLSIIHYPLIPAYCSDDFKDNMQKPRGENKWGEEASQAFQVVESCLTEDRCW